jgi:prepilin peptidase CpaA
MVFTWVYLLLLFEISVVAWTDFKREIIPNSWVIGNAGCAFLMLLFYPQYFPASWEMMLFPGGFVLIGFILFWLGIMGAGDSKYLASLFLLTPLEQQFIFFEKLIVSTLLVGSMLLALRLIKERGTIKAYLVSFHWKGIKQILRSRFSYAPVILIAWILLGLSYFG